MFSRLGLTTVFWLWGLCPSGNFARNYGTLPPGGARFPLGRLVRSQPGPTRFFQPFLHHLIASLICLLRPQDIATDPFYGERPVAVRLALHDSPPLDCSSLFVTVIRRESFSFCYASGLCPLLPIVPVFWLPSSPIAGGEKPHLHH